MGVILGGLLSCSSPPNRQGAWPTGKVPDSTATVHMPSSPLSGPAAGSGEGPQRGSPEAARALIPAAGLPPARAPVIGLAGVPGTPSPSLSLRSRWISVPWSDLPGWQDDSMAQAWNAWLKNCERPGPLFAPLCADVRRLVLADDSEQRLWMLAHLQPYRVESLDGVADGLMTSYYEPLMQASRVAQAGFAVPLYAYPPQAQAAQRAGRPWYTRQQLDTQLDARAAVSGREIAWLADPVDALVLHIQGSGKLRVTEPNGSTRLVRLAFAGSNEQPYQSVGRWLLDQGLVRDASWPGIKAWVVQNPQRVPEMLWANPRYVFFREEALPDGDDSSPRGAQGVPLTPGRSIAVDRDSVPYGTPVWLASQGSAGQLQRLVFAQDTGSAITGAVRADYFAGSGAAAGDWAGRVRQNLRLWVLWPK